MSYFRLEFSKKFLKTTVNPHLTKNILNQDIIDHAHILLSAINTAEVIDRLYPT
jgi:hypothetical protein